MINLRLKELREDKDIKQREIAEYLNCKQTCYSKYELRQRDIPTEVLYMLADYYGVSVDYLLGRTDLPTPYPTSKRQ